MSLMVTLKDVRDQLSELVARVTFGEQKVVITRFGKPVAALVTYDDYKRLMNPAKRFSKKEWKKGFKLMDKARANAKQFKVADVQKAIDKAVKDVRKSKHVQIHN